MDRATADTIMAKLWLFGCISVAGILWAACNTQASIEDEDTSVEGVQSIDLFSSRGGAFRLADTPVIVVGTSDSLPLAGARTAVFFGDGVVIANSTYNELLILDAAGGLVSRKGGRGEGPGEYVSLGGVVRHGDGLVTWDLYNGRVTLLDGEGQYEGETRFGLRSFRFPRIIGAFGNSVLVEFWLLGFQGEGPAGPLEVRADVEYEIVSLLDGARTLEAALPGEESWVARDGTIHGGLPVIFGRRAVGAVTDHRAYLATTDSLTLQSYDEMGNREIVSLGQRHRVAVPDQWVQIVRDTLRRNIEKTPELVGGAGPFIRNLMEFRRRLLSDLPSRSTLPSFSAIMGATDGRLWIRGYSDPTQDRDVWVGLSEGWVPEQWIEIPKNLTVLDLSEDRVLVWRRGEFEEDIVEVYAIER